MEEAIVFILSNFTLTLFIMSLFTAAISLSFKKNALDKPLFFDILFSHFLLFNVGISYIYNFVVHVFFGEMAASFIGWSQSPFQLEVGFASLGFGVVGIISFWAGFGFRAATIIAPSLFLWGAAGGHVYQMVVANNFAPGNAGIIFWSDIFIPVIGLTLLYFDYKYPMRPNQKAMYNVGTS